MSVGAAEAAGAADSGSYYVQDCGDGSYNYQRHDSNSDGSSNNNWGSGDF